MARGKSLKRGGPAALERLREVWNDAEHWPLAGSAVKRAQEAESWALLELKQRLDALEGGVASHAESSAYEAPIPPSHLLADLLVRQRSVDPDLARDDLYRRILGDLLPDEVGMLRVLAKRRIAPLCDIGGARLPAGSSISLIRIRNATSLGQEAGVLLREYTPRYMTQLLQLGLVEAGPEDDALSSDYELLLADSHIRHAMDTIRDDFRLYPRVIRRSVSMSPLGEALWRDCFPAAQTASARWTSY